MDFWDLSKLLFRRWYVAAPLLLLSLTATFLIGSSVKPDYIATSYVQLIPPTVVQKEKVVNGVVKQDTTPRNPWLELGLNALSRAGMLTVQDKTVLKQLDAAGMSENVLVTVDPQTPVITIEVVGETEAQATVTADEVYERLAANIGALQADYGAKKESFITARRLDRGDNIEESNAKVKRALIAVAAVGFLLTIALTIAVDALIRRRRKNREADEPASAATDPVPDSGSAPVSKPTPENHNGFGPLSAPGGMPAPARLNPVTPAPRRPMIETLSNSPGDKTVVISRGSQDDKTIVLPRPTRSNDRRSNNGGQEPTDSGRR